MSHSEWDREKELVDAYNQLNEAVWQVVFADLSGEGEAVVEHLEAAQASLDDLGALVIGGEK